jgi:hypothetical protein
MIRCSVRFIGSLAIGVIISILFTSAAEAATQRVALMLSGPSCEEDQKAIRQDLEMMHGVKAVDLISLRGFALLDVEASTASLDELTSAVSRQHREPRQCRAQVMESCISTPQHGLNLHHGMPSP